MAPDLLVALRADPETYRENNGYIISDQGKPPDFVLEIASPEHRQTRTSWRRGRPTANLRNPRVLAVRRDRGVPRDPSRRRPTGGWPI